MNGYTYSFKNAAGEWVKSGWFATESAALAHADKQSDNYWKVAPATPQDARQNRGGHVVGVDPRSGY